jgi:hypothetical protein
VSGAPAACVGSRRQPSLSHGPRRLTSSPTGMSESMEISRLASHRNPHSPQVDFTNPIETGHQRFIPY